MSPKFLPAIPRASTVAQQVGLQLTTLSYLGSLFTTVTPHSLDETLDFLQELAANYGTTFSIYLDVTNLRTTHDIVALLDAGAGKVFVSFQQLKELDSVKNIDPQRLALRITEDRSETKEAIVEAIGDTAVDLYFHSIKDVPLIQEFLRLYGESRPAVYVSLATDAATSAAKATYLSLIQSSAIPIIPAAILGVEKELAPDSIPVASLLRIETDRPDGLIPTIVTNEGGIALGLVYSSSESLQESLRTGRGVYQSRKRGLWYKGESSGDIQELVSISVDCDSDCLAFTVRQQGRGFCHLVQATCFGEYKGLAKLQKTLQARKVSAPEGSYTARLFTSPDLLRAKIMEEAQELCEAKTKEEVAFEAADLMYFALVKCVEAGVTLEDVERNLDTKSVKVKRRQGDAKGPRREKQGLVNGSLPNGNAKEVCREAASAPKVHHDHSTRTNGLIKMKRLNTATTSAQIVREALQRPSQRSTDSIMNIVHPIIKAVRERGDAALLEYTHKFEKATSLKSTVLKAPFPQSLMQLSPETISAIDTSFENIRKFHAAQREDKPLVVETMPGVTCSRFSRPIERVGLYVPGGTAILPSTALMLGVPAQVAGCKKIVIASPPRSDGSITPEIVYVAHKVGAESIVLAGGAQAVAALAYGTESVTKVDKILGPGNQFVTAAKMFVANDTNAGVSIDMPAGPSELLVVADATANPAFVASDLLSQAEHGLDSQVVLIAVGLNEKQLGAIEDEVHSQSMTLPRVDLVRGAISHSSTFVVKDIEEAMALSNEYAPEHLILQVADAAKVVDLVENAGSIFVGPWTPESVGDYSAGVNHSLPTYGYAKQYSGVNLATYVKHITSAHLTAQGLKNVGSAVMQLAGVEQLEAHKRAVSIRLQHMEKSALQL